MTIAFYVFVVLFLYGLANVSYSAWKSRKTPEFAISLTCMLAGLLGIANEWMTLTRVQITSIAIVLLAGLSISVYLSFGRNHRVLPLIGALFIPPLGSYVYPIPLPAVAAYYLLVILIYNAYDYGSSDMTACMRNAHRFLRYALLPFWVIQGLTVSLTGGRISRINLAGGYLLFGLIIFFGTPLVVAMAEGWTDLLVYLMLASLTYLVLSREEFFFGKRRLNSPES